MGLCLSSETAWALPRPNSAPSRTLQRCCEAFVSAVGLWAVAAPQPYLAVMQSVLVVASDPHLSRVVRWVLAEIGLQVVEAAGIDDALSLVRAERPDAIVFNTGLPDGIKASAIEMIREYVPGVPVIALDDRPTEPALEQQADAIIYKPFHADSLVDSLRHMLGTNGAA
jgi:DNA-binding response OmpR family regulator